MKVLILKLTCINFYAHLHYKGFFFLKKKKTSLASTKLWKIFEGPIVLAND